MNSGSIFDNIFLGDDPAEALEFSKRTFANRQDGEPMAKLVFEEDSLRIQEEAFEQMAVDTEDDFEPDL